MSDDFNSAQAGASPPNMEMPAKKPGLLSSTGGKIVAILIGLGAIAVIVGIVAMIFLGVFGNSDSAKFTDDPGQVSGETTSGAGTSGETTSAPPVAAASAQPAQAVANKEVFTFRDVFVPLLKQKPAAPEPGTGGGSTTDTETATVDGVLYVTDIITQDGELKVVATLNGKTYTLGEGESIPGTPWKVLRVTSTQVTFLYGDVLVYLTIGQGITK